MFKIYHSTSGKEKGGFIYNIYINSDKIEFVKYDYKNNKIVYNHDISSFGIDNLNMDLFIEKFDKLSIFS